MPLEQVARFEAAVEDDRLVYTFSLTMPAPVEVATRDLALGVFDPEYYVELTLDADDPVRFARATA